MSTMLLDRFTTEIRTFIGEPTSLAGSGYAGFIVGVTYEVHFSRRPDGTVLVEQAGNSGKEPILIGERLFERWWIPRRAA